MSMSRNIWLCSLISLAFMMAATSPTCAQQQQKPNILVIMGDDIGYWNISARQLPICSNRRATRPDNSARTTSATATNSCRPCTASTSSSATFTT